MTFLGAWWLALAGAMAVPLLLHLRRRPVSQRLRFPAIRWLKRAQKEHSRELKLRNLLLMLLRAAVVLLLALAAARPLVRGIPGGHAPAALVVVLDNSMSTTRATAGETALDRLRAAAGAVVQDASSADRVWLVTADGSVTGGTAAQVRDAIRTTAAWAGAGDMPAAVEKAATLALGVRGLAPRVVVLTDGQASAWPRAAAAEAAGATVFVPAVSLTDPGAAVLDASPSPPRWSPRGRLRIRVAGADTVPVMVRLAGRTLARARLSPGANGWVAASPVERGWVAGDVSSAPDALRGDDVRHFAVWVGPAPAVALGASAGPFARAAIDALTADGRATAGAAGIAIASADEVRALPAVLLPPADAARIPAANASLARLGVPWRFERAVAGRAPVRGAAWLTGATVQQRWRVVRADAGDAGPGDTLATAGGEPWWVAGPRWVVMASRLDTAHTDIMLRAGFVPWLGETLAARLAGDGGPLVTSAPGAMVTWPTALDALETPEGVRTVVTSRAWPAPAVPGVYFAVRRGARTGALVVNPEVEESDVAVWTARDVASRVQGASVRAVDDVPTAVRRAWGADGGAALFGPLLVAGMLALVAEALVARHGRDA
jgi:hypothetical protein